MRSEIVRPGSIRWVHSPNRNQLPLLGYVRQVDEIDEEVVHMLLVDDDSFMASAHDLIYSSSDHGYQSDLVVHPRISFSVPQTCLGATVAFLTVEATQEIAQMFTGERRAAQRTGPFVRETADLRWQHTLDLVTMVDNLIIELERDPQVFRVIEKLGTVPDPGPSVDPFEIVRSLAVLVSEESADFKVLDLEALKAAGLNGLLFDVVAGVQAQARQLLQDPDRLLRLGQDQREFFERLCLGADQAIVRQRHQVMAAVPAKN